MRSSWAGPPFAGLLTAAGLCLAQLAAAGDLVVSSVADGGSGSLRQALLDANANPGADRIIFNIPGAGVHTISLSAALPPILESLDLDGSTQPGYSQTPLIELNGGTAPSATSGLRILAPNCTVRGLAINSFPGDGLRIEGGGTNTIAGNFIGTDPAGASPRGNGGEGILVSLSWANQIGGVSAGQGNLLSGNGDAGLYVYGAGYNIVEGNRIGSDLSGTVAVGNTNNGIAIFGSQGNRIGSGTAGGRNLLSGNRGSGIYVINGFSVSNLIVGNFIGTTLAGTGPLSNAADGITIQSAGCNGIGATAAGSGNVVSGNGKTGISIIGPGATNNWVQQNFIGTDASGGTALPNNSVGLWLEAAQDNQIGGAGSDFRNVISGNRQDGVYLLTNSSGNVLAANFIGVDAAGKNRLPNGFNGISLTAATNNLIGGVSPTESNLISGNGGHGIQITVSASGNRIAGNYIGTSSSGSQMLSNGLAGIRIESTGNTIGGYGCGNLISGNGQDGIYLYSSAASNNVILGNRIGAAANGTGALGNGRVGILFSGAGFNIIGSALAGGGNVISANRDAGLYLDQAGTRENQFLGNRIGTDAGGNAKLGNAFEGIYGDRAGTNYFGSSLPGGGNLISGNNTWGMYFLRSSGNQFQGNLVGIAVDGTTPLPNVYHNLELDAGCTNNLVGGSGPAGNRIAYAATIYAGVRIRTGSVRNEIRGNLFFGNGGLGIDLGDLGVTPNDSCDADEGANGLQNFPVITNAVSGAATEIRGRLNSKASTVYDLEFFANPVCHTSGNGEAAILLGTASVTTGGGCSGNFLARLPVALPPGYVVTATAIAGNGNTSEFSACFPVMTIPSPQIAVVTGQVRISWPNTGQAFTLQQTGSLGPPVKWTAVGVPPQLQSGRWICTVPLSVTNSFYALSYE